MSRSLALRAIAVAVAVGDTDGTVGRALTAGESIDGVGGTLPGVEQAVRTMTVTKGIARAMRD